MSRKTDVVPIGRDWTPLSAGENTVLIQCRHIGLVEIALADAIEDFDANAIGHSLGGEGGASAAFTDLDGVMVFARSSEPGADLIVTRY